MCCWLRSWGGSNWDGPESRDDEAWPAPIGETFFLPDGGDSFVASERGDRCASIDSPVGGAAISGLSWDAYPRRPVAISPAPDDLDAVRRLLVADGLSDVEEGIQGAIRVDLEGDGGVTPHGDLAVGDSGRSDPEPVLAPGMATNRSLGAVLSSSER